MKFHGRLVNNEKLRLKMGINAQKRIEKIYHIHDTVEDTMELYKQLLER